MQDASLAPLREPPYNFPKGMVGFSVTSKMPGVSFTKLIITI